MTKKLPPNFFPKNILAAFTDSSIDFSLDPNYPKLNQKQRRSLKDFRNIKSLCQIHGKSIVVVTGKSRPFQKADGILTRDKNVAVMIRVADCLPIYIYDPKSQGIGLVHAGWKGTKKGIIQNALKMMKRRWSTNIKNIQIAFGPCISMKHYQVSKEFKKYFPKETQQNKDGWCFDLKKANKNQLLQSGVNKRNIKDLKKCTYSDKMCFSYRRQGQKAGRMAAVMMIKA